MTHSVTGRLVTKHLHELTDFGPESTVETAGDEVYVTGATPTPNHPRQSTIKVR
jgi:hypothetical protein